MVTEALRPEDREQCAPRTLQTVANFADAAMTEAETAMTSLVRPADARTLRLVSLYPPAQVIAFAS